MSGVENRSSTVEVVAQAKPSAQNADNLPILGAHPLGGYSPSLALLGVSYDVPDNEKYIYEPLPIEGEFVRLLEADLASEKLSFHLTTVALADCSGLYDALSYVWGDPLEKINITIDGKILPVTVNLFQALNGLLSKGGPRRLWIDAICVNQEDLNERSSQVRLMGKIYKQSGNVPIWLGQNKTDISLPCVNLLKDTAAASRKIWETYGHENNIPNPMVDNPICSDPKQWDMVREMTNLPWFSRVWVLQEAGLALQATMVWGEATINISDIVEVSNLCLMAGHLFPVSDIGLFKITDTFADLWNSMATSASWKRELSKRPVQSLEAQRPKVSFTEVLHIGRRFEATDHRDYVFAFLGHPSALNPQTGEILLNPDYNKSLLDVYYETACALLKIAELSFILSCVDRNQETLDSDFPSWVPHWNLAKNVCALAYPTLWYYAGGRDTTPVFSLNDDRSLQIEGFILDTITWAGLATTESDFSAHPVGENRPVVEQIWQNLVANEDAATQYPPEDKVEAFSLTLVANAAQADQKPSQLADEHREGFRGYCAKFGCAIQDVGLEGAKSESWRFERGAAWAAHNRRVFRTKTGYYGLAHRLIREGDVCCVFPGLRVPFVLRPVRRDGGGPAYKLVGDAYVHGVMRGEAMMMLKGGEAVLQNITII
ncbi:heterokaryon incompatibility domain-containing protein [Trichoderma afarasin]